MLTVQFAGQQTVEKAFEDLEMLISQAEGADRTITDRLSQLHDIDNRLANVQAAEKQAEARIMQEINAEVDDRGKKSYSNAEARKAELLRRMEDNEARAETAQLVQEKIQAEADISQTERQLRHINRRMQFLHARISYGAAILNVFKGA